MRKSSVVLMTAGIIFGAIIIVWRIIPFLPYQGPLVTWTDEANEYMNQWVGKIFAAITLGIPEPGLTYSLRNHAEEIARDTDYLVHIIDVRLGVAMFWWKASQPEGRNPGRYNWTTAWQRLIQIEEIVGVELWVDWSFEAVKYYWNPGDPIFDVPDQPDCMMVILRGDSNFETEFRSMVAGATAEVEDLASMRDKVVDLADLREAIATVLYEYSPELYPTMAEAWTRLEKLEDQVGCS